MCPEDFSCLVYEAEVNAPMAGYFCPVHPVISLDMLMQDLHLCQPIPVDAPP
jgi:hypothetical protein